MRVAELEAKGDPAKKTFSETAASATEPVAEVVAEPASAVKNAVPDPISHVGNKVQGPEKSKAKQSKAKRKDYANF